MRELLARYGIGTPMPLVAQAPAATIQAEQRKSQPFGTRLITFSGTPFQPRRHKRRVSDLKTLSESCLPSRAIRLIRNSLASLQYGIQPKKGIEKTPAIVKAADQVRSVLDNPNSSDDDFPSFVGPVVEDLLVFDAGCWEYVDRPRYVTGNNLVGLEVVTGYSIAHNPKWDGNPKTPRWAELLDQANIGATFLDSQLEYLTMRRRSWTAFGLSPLETAIDLMDAWLNLSSYQRKVASESYPSFLIYLGDNATQDQVDQFKYYWTNELQGRGTPGFFGGWDGKPEALQLKSQNDAGLYLSYQEMLIRVLAFCFDLKPQDFGLERDVNRSTAEVSQDASIREASFPIAQILQAKMNQRVLPRIASVSGNKLINDLEFFWINIDPGDDSIQAEIHRKYLDNDVLTIDEVRAELDREPLPNDLGKLTKTGLQEFLKINPTGEIEGVSLNAPPTKAPIAASRTLFFFGENGLEEMQSEDASEALARQVRGNGNGDEAMQHIINRSLSQGARIQDLENQLRVLEGQQKDTMQINVSPPSVKVDVHPPDVNVDVHPSAPSSVTLEGTTINVPIPPQGPPEVNLNIEAVKPTAKQRIVKRVERDEKGNILRIVEESNE